MNNFTQFIIRNTVEGKIDKRVGAEMVKMVLEDGRKTEPKDIAIIGIAVKMPMAEDVDSFWSNLKNGVDCTRDFPSSRRDDLEELLRVNFNFHPDSIKYKRASYLESIDKFDYGFFNISPLEAKVMDPNQRLFLQTAYQAIEDAGYGGGKLTGTNTGVFVGYSSWSVYGSYIMKTDPSLTGVSIPGNMSAIISGRLSYLLDLKGPSLLVDTACSSSLVAIYLACKSIRSGDCNQALAGGIRINFLPVDGMYETGIESKCGQTRTFDQYSDGTNWGEGVAAVMLKPLQKAMEDGDPIYAVIKGGAANQDGTSVSMTAPNSLAQKEVIVKAWKDAQIDPETISYIEAHGTGTKLGDPVEIAGIQKAFMEHTNKKQFCAIGSLKTNIGHLDNAAGAASLIKAALALKHKVIPPTLHFSQPNRAINFEQSPVYVSDRAIPWETDGFPRRCGISSFGFSGTNCHIILEEAPQMEVPRAEETPVISSSPHILVLSARSRESLNQLIESYKKFLGKTRCALADICYTAATGRGHFEYRLAVIADSVEDARGKLNALEASCLDRDSYFENGVYYAQEASDSKALDFTREAVHVLEKLLSGNEQAAKFRTEICSMYVQGADIDWKKFYSKNQVKKVNLPAYAFERKRCWIDWQNTSSEQQKAPDKQMKHPLLDVLLADSMNQKIYATYFNTKKHWVLDEHRILGNGTVPGTTYLEMMREVCSLDFPDSTVILRDVYFIDPLVVNEGEYKEAQTIVRLDENGSLEFVIASRSESGSWVKHVEASGFCTTESGARREENNQPDRMDVDAIKTSCTQREISETEYDNDGSVTFGPRWKCAREVYVGTGEVLSLFELPARYMADTEMYKIHPALMDCAVNITNGTLGDGLYLPIAYKTLNIYHPMPGRFYSYIKRTDQSNETRESATFDITLLHEDGRVFAKVEGYVVKKVNDVSGKFGELKGKAGLYHATEWIPEANDKPASNPAGERILVIGKQDGIAYELVNMLKQRGAEVLIASMGDCYKREDNNIFTITAAEEDYTRLIRESDGSGFTKILHLLNLDMPFEWNDMQSLKDTKDRSVLSLLHLTKALNANEVKNNIDLVLVADQAAQVTHQEKWINPLHGAFLSMGKVIASECPNLRVRCIDIEGPSDAQDVLNEILAGGEPYPIAYRKGQRYVKQFKTVDPAQKSSVPFSLRSQGIYLITGGLGGIGLEMGKHLAKKGNINLCLIGRTELPGVEQWDDIIRENQDVKLCRKLTAMKEMQKSGANVVCSSADVSSFEQMEELIGRLRSEFGGINGIIHAAGVAGDGFLINKSENTFENVIRPKIDGTLILDSLTEKDDMDFFILFSSVVAIAGGPGQGDYTAANSFLDTFSAYRNRRGKPTLSINWTAWSETGMAVDFGIDLNGVFKAISTQDALKAFDQVVEKNIEHIMIAELNYENQVFENEAIFPLRLSDEIRSQAKRSKNKREQGKQQKAAKPAGGAKLIGRPDGNYTETELRIGKIWALVLGIDEIDIHEDFFVLGGNSLLALKLEAEMEKDNLQIQYSDISLYPTIEELAKYFDGKHNETNDSGRGEIVQSQDINSTAAVNMEDEMTGLSSGGKISASGGNSLVLQPVEPFNEIIYRGCFYSAFFPAVMHFNRPIEPFLANDVSVYDCSGEAGSERLDIRYESDKSLESVCRSIGLNMMEKNISTDVVGDITAAILSRKLTIICVDCFYVSIRQDTYEKTHWPHCLLVYGVDQNEKLFHVLEHRSAGSTMYEKRTISFEDMVNGYKGYLENLRQYDIRTLGFNKSFPHDRSVFPTYFEIGRDEEHEYSKDTGYAQGFAQSFGQRFASNMVDKKSQVMDGLRHLEDFCLKFEATVFQEEKLKAQADDIMTALNVIINAKLGEKFKLMRIYGDCPEIMALIEQSLSDMEFIRTSIARFVYSSQYRQGTIVKCVEKFKGLCRNEVVYLNQLYSMFR